MNRFKAIFIAAATTLCTATSALAGGVPADMRFEVADACADVGGFVTVDVVIDGGGTPIGGYNANLEWDTATLSLVGFTVDATVFESVINTDMDGSDGDLLISGADVHCPTGSGPFTIMSLTFEVIAANDCDAYVRWDTVNEPVLPAQIQDCFAMDLMATLTDLSLSTDDTSPVVVPTAIDTCYPSVAAAEAAAIMATTATDNCTSTVALSASTTGDCSATVTVLATDDCGNTALVTYNTRIDDEAPVPDPEPADATYTCLSAVPAPGMLEANDNCDGTLVAMGVDSPDGGAGCPGDPLEITRTWSFSDACGNTSEAVQIITVIDDVAPTLTAGMIDDCYDDEASAEAAAIAATMASDNCSGVSLSADTVGECSATITVTGEDACGNMSSVVYNTSIDSTDPDTPATPTPEDFQCVDDVPDAATDMLSTTDNCDGMITVGATDMDNGGAGCDGDELIITRTWDFVDACGNATSVSQIITVSDTIAPMVLSCPDDINVTTDPGECSAMVMVPDPVVSDNCGTPTIAYMRSDGMNINDDFPIGPTTVTFLVVDDCDNGNTSCSLVVTVDDETGPVFSNIPPDDTIECGDPLPTDAPDADDACEGPVAVTFTDVQTVMGCGDTGVIERTFSAMDSLGNVSTVTVTYTIVDTTAPVFTMTPADDTIECSDPVPMSSATATDDCGGTPTVTQSDDTSGLTGCSDTGDILRTFIATDDCGNTTAYVQTITVVDTTSPTISAGMIDDCYDSVAAAESAAIAATTTSDNCGTPVLSASTLGVCDVVITVTSTDDCGNTSAVDYMTRVDGENPTPIAPPMNAAFQCSDDVPTAPTVEASDNCDPLIMGVLDESDNMGAGCAANPLIITRTWTFTDTCGNESEHTQTIVVADTMRPTLVPGTCPTSKTATADPGECGAQVTIDLPDAEDNCDPDPAVFASRSDMAGLNEDFPVGVTTVTFFAEDDCGNVRTLCMITVTVTDDEDPTITCPMVEASYDNDPGECGAIVDYDPVVVDDNCGIMSTTLEEGLPSGALFPVGTTTVRWRTTDNSGNFVECSFDIVVVDVEDPTIVCVSDITTDADAGTCDAVVTYASPVSDDNCATASLVQTAGLPSGSTFPPGTTTNTFVVTDDAGNMSECSFDVTVTGQNQFFGTVAFDAGVFMAADYVRCVEYQFFSGSTLVHSIPVNIAFSGNSPHAGSIASDSPSLVPCGSYDCVKVRDPLHSLLREATVTTEPGSPMQYKIEAVDLIPGDLDGNNVSNLADFVIAASEEGMDYGTGDTTCGTAAPNADFNGDGEADFFGGDLAILSFGFGETGDKCPLEPIFEAPPSEILLATATNGFEPMSVAALWAAGLGHYTVADLTGDGWIDFDDVAAAANGQRPAILNVFMANGGSWFDDSNWSRRGQPNADTDVAFNNHVVVDKAGALARDVRILAGGELAMINGGLTARRLTVESGATLSLVGSSALSVESLILEEGATLVWLGGTIEIAGGVYAQADRDLVIGEATVSAMRLIAGASSRIEGDTYLGFAEGSTGILEVEASTFETGGVLHVGYDGTGYLHVASGGMVTAGTVDVGWFGQVSGNGLLNGTVRNLGVVAPQGELTVLGDYYQVPEQLTKGRSLVAPGGTLAVRLGVEAHDALVVTGNVYLGGTLEVALDEGYVPGHGTVFEIVVGASVMDEFTTVALPTLQGRTFEVIYEDGRVLIEVTLPKSLGRR